MKTENDKESPELLRLRKRITASFHKACADYSLIQDGDKILIGLSGGKDSLALVELLGRRSKIFVPRFSVIAAHIIVDNIGYQSDIDYLQLFCQQHGVEFHVINTSYEEQPTKQKNHCFICSWYRRKTLFDFAKQQGCNKLALGHHKDDIVETLLMNLVFQGAFATIPPKLKMSKFDMTLIRPLCLIKEDDLRQYSTMCGYKKMPKLCPFEKESSRAKVRSIVGDLKNLNPQLLDSVWGAMENIKTDYLPSRQ